MRSLTISNSIRIDGTRMGGGWWCAMGTCRSGRWSVEWVRSGSVSHGSGIGTRVVFQAQFCPSKCVGLTSVDALIPALYLKGISTGDFTEALEAILGEGASGLSATNIVRLKAGWESDYKTWTQRDLSQKRYVYWWADGVYFNVRLDEERTCVLILIGATEDGTKELLAVVDGCRESTQSWRELLGQLKRQGLSSAPKLAIGDGSLGFWIALQEEYGPVSQQRCWVHKTANILDKMPKSVQGKAKQLIHEMYLAPTEQSRSGGL
jgi:putative transposase